MIEFERIDLARRGEYAQYLQTASHRGSGFSFANLYMWGCQRVRVLGEHLLIFSHFTGHTLYPFPAGSADPRPALDAIMADAAQRGIPCRITGITAHEREMLEEFYPGRFCFHCDRDSYDYVYDIHDLAELKGRRYQQKRNHVNRFTLENPDAYVEILDESNLPLCREFVEEWYRRRAAENPDEDIQMEHTAICRAFRNYRELGLEGLVLYAGGRPVAMTMGSFLCEDTVDVHFEKADPAVNGAYPAINRAFARYIRDKYPAVKYLNREDDMGAEGLRRAKLSYHPHHMVEKCWTHLKSEDLDD